jgi:hypothetical protein
MVLSGSRRGAAVSRAAVVGERCSTAELGAVGSARHVPGWLTAVGAAAVGEGAIGWKGRGEEGAWGPGGWGWQWGLC